jgi:phosphatidate cytidylyltransferase
MDPTAGEERGRVQPNGPDPALQGLAPAAPAELGPARRLSNLSLRLITAAILVPLVVWVTWLGGVAYVATVIVFAVVAVNEFYNFISAKGANPHRLLGTLGTAALPLAMWIGDAFWATSLMTAVLLTVMILQLVEREIHEAIASVSATFFGVFYVGWLLSHAVSLRFIEHDLVRRYGAGAAGLDADVGFFYMLLCMSAAVLCDAGAYFVGRAYGRRKLAPAISPNKTVEGALGGMAVGALGAVAVKIAFDFFVPGELSRDLGYGAALVFGLVISAVGILGDLVESLLKRDAALKDAGALLPGVGGLLDRIDSGLLAIPVTYYLLLAYYFFLLGA